MQIRSFRSTDYDYFQIPPFPGGGHAWVGLDPFPVGYVGYVPLPGLPHLADLYGYVFPTQRRMGYGSRLLRYLLDELADSPIRQIAAPCDHLQTSVALFLRQRGFVHDHEEIELVRHNLNDVGPTGRRLRQYPEADALPLMRRLYDEAFRPTPWYQPYVSDDELRDDLGRRSDIFFLAIDERPIGFAAVRYVDDTAEIEPLGVIAEYQGRGYGRMLLSTLLYELAIRRVAAARLSMWANNPAAYQLYRQLGFQIAHSRIYLAYNLPGKGDGEPETRDG